MSNEDGFFLVWSPKGAKPPSYRHDTHDSAVSEAERLARKFPGDEFYVLAAVSLRVVDNMTRIDLVPDDIPF